MIHALVREISAAVFSDAVKSEEGVFARPSATNHLSDRRFARIRTCATGQ